MALPRQLSTPLLMGLSLFVMGCELPEPMSIVESEDGSVIVVDSPSSTGTFYDSEVAGVSYTTSGGESGVTDASGQFSYSPGDTVTFTLGGTTLGSVAGAELLSPVDVVGASDTADQRVINLSRLLQTLDSDNDSDNGITIEEAARSALEGYQLDFDQSPTDFESAAGATIEQAAGRKLHSSAKVLKHLHASLKKKGKNEQQADNAKFSGLLADDELVSLAEEEATADCTFQGATVVDGQTVTAYQETEVPFGDI